MKKYLVIMAGLLILLLTIIPIMAAGHQKYDMALNLTKGQIYTLKCTNTMKMEQDFGFGKMITNQKTVGGYNFKVSDVIDKNSYNFLMEFKDIYSEVSVGVSEGETYMSEYLPDNVKDLLEGSTVNMQMTKRGEIISIDGMDKLWNDFLHKLDELDMEPTAKQFNKNMLQQFSSEDLCKKSWENYFSYIPKKPVELGEKWFSEFNLAQPVPITIKTEYTLKNVDKDEIVIDVNGDCEMNGSMNFETSIVECNIKGKQIGQITIDRSSGWIKTMYLEHSLSGVMIANIPDQGKVELPLEAFVSTEEVSE